MNALTDEKVPITNRRQRVRSRLYGRSRANRWPLWISWLLAPAPSNRRMVRELMEIRRGGGDV